MAVTSSAIVEGLDVVGNVRYRNLSLPVDVFLDPLLLQTAEEGLSHSVIPAVALPAHARLKVVCFAESFPGVAPILRTLIRMDQRASRASMPDRHHGRIEDELAVNRRAGGPPDDLSGEQIHDNGQVQPALTSEHT